MKRTLKYKGFIPIEFREKIIKTNYNSYKRAIGLLMILNLALLPLNLNAKDDKKESYSNITTEKQTDISKNLILSWIEMADEDVINMNISNGAGTIVTSKKEKVYFLEKQGYKINEVISREGNIRFYVQKE